MKQMNLFLPTQSELNLPPVRKEAQAVPEPETSADFQKHFHSIKGKYPDAILLYRHNEFYIAYGEDAVRTEQQTGIAKLPSTFLHYKLFMSFNALDVHMRKLIKAGYRVAICDKLENPPKP